MRILLSSYAFPPSVGGLEEVSELLACEFSTLGHEVVVVTMTPSAEPDKYPFRVVRQPGLGDLLECVRWCEIYLQEGISLRLALPLLAARRPWVVALQSPPFLQERRLRLALLAKQFSLRFASVITCSASVAQGLGRDATVIPNPYRSAVFQRLPSQERPYDLVFLGRLVSDKGMSVLIDALGVLRKQGVSPRLLIIGGGPEEPTLRESCVRLGLDKQVEFAGVLRGSDLVRRLNQCRIMVVPSTWQEPFGIVALEGIACGCVVVASHAGGLPEAVGPCGLTFPMGDVGALATEIAALLRDSGRFNALRHQAASHLSRHTPRAVADAYLAVLESARAGQASGTPRSLF
jgi:glycogen synthase